MLHIEEKGASKRQKILRNENTEFYLRGYTSNVQNVIYLRYQMGCQQLTYQKDNFLQVVHRKNGQMQKKNALDYFSLGSPWLMPWQKKEAFFG